EQAIGRLAHVLKVGPAWTAGSHLPGGDFPHDGIETLIADTRQRWPFLSEPHARRLVRAYGTRVRRLLKSVKHADDLGEKFGADLHAAEVRYLIDQEWARSVDDVLWRRSKLGLRVSANDRERLAAFMAQAIGAASLR